MEVPAFANIQIVAIVVLLLSWLLLSIVYLRNHAKSVALVKIALTTLAFAALAGLMLEPKFLSEGSGRVLLVVGNAPEPLKDSLINLYPNLDVVYANHVGYPSVETSIAKLPTGKNLIVTGDLLSVHVANLLTTYNWQYLPSGLPKSYLLPIKLPNYVALGDSLVLAGALQGGNSVAININGAQVDSVEAVSRYTYRYLPKSEGLEKITITLKSERGEVLDSLNQYVQVIKPAKLTLAILTDYPSGESKYLKEFLREQGHHVYYAAQIAPGIRQEDKINRPPAYALTSQAWQRYDAVLISAGYWQKHSKQLLKLMALANGQRDKATGILIFGASANSEINVGKNLTLTPRAVAGQVGYLGTPRSSFIKLSSHIIKAIDKPLALFRYTDTFPLRLQGKRQQYQRIWYAALQGVVSPAPMPTLPLGLKTGQVGSQWSYILPPASWSLIKPQADTISLSTAGQPHVYTFYPKATGKYQFVRDSASFTISVQQSHAAWQKVDNHKKIDQIDSKNKQQASTTAYSVYLPISDWWYFFLFIIGAGLLWSIDRWYA